MKTKLGSILSAFSLLIALALPNVKQWVHLVEDHHKEEYCYKNNLHFHEVESSCALTATFTAPYTFNDLTEFSLLDLQEAPFLLESRAQPLQLHTRNDFYLRGPPSLM